MYTETVEIEMHSQIPCTDAGVCYCDVKSRLTTAQIFFLVYFVCIPDENYIPFLHLSLLHVKGD